MLALLFATPHHAIGQGLSSAFDDGSGDLSGISTSTVLMVAAVAGACATLGMCGSTQ